MNMNPSLKLVSPSKSWQSDRSKVTLFNGIQSNMILMPIKAKTFEVIAL